MDNKTIAFEMLRQTLEERQMKIIYDKVLRKAVIDDEVYVPEHDQKSLLRMTEKEMRAILETQNAETLIKLAKCCHGVIYHKLRRE
jgi:hypothetical protein